MTEKQIEDMQTHLISFGIEDKYDAGEILNHYNLLSTDLNDTTELSELEAPLHIWYKASKILA